MSFCESITASFAKAALLLIGIALMGQFLTHYKVEKDEYLRADEYLTLY